MYKIFKYELKRLLWNKFFFGILGVLVFYGWQVLQDTIIAGISHTAPFSPWSFGYYLSQMMPILWVGMMFFLTFFTSNAERRAAALTSVTPVNPRTYAQIRAAAALVGTTVLAMAVLILAAVFYGEYFQWYQWGSLVFPTLITLVPPLIFALGSGWVLGQIRPFLVFVWMLLPFLFMILPLPEALEVWNGQIFISRPLAIEHLDPAFSLPVESLILQFFILAVGLLLFFLMPKWNLSKHRK